MNKKNIISIAIPLFLLTVICIGSIFVLKYRPVKFLFRHPKPKAINSRPRIWPSRDLQEGKPFSTDYDGIDISLHQGCIRWKEIDSIKPKFIYIRAMGRKARYDSLYQHNLTQARIRKIPVGTYIFYTHDIPVREQFRKFIAAARKEEQDMIPVIDVEELSISADVNIRQLKDSVMLLSRYMKQFYGKHPMIYSNQNFYVKYLAPELNRHTLWIANYSRRPVISGARPILWQRSESGHVPGIYTSVDLDTFINGGSIKHLILR